MRRQVSEEYREKRTDLHSLACSRLGCSGLSSSCNLQEGRPFAL